MKKSKEPPTYPRLLAQGKYKNYAGELRLIQTQAEKFVVERESTEVDTLMKTTSRWNVVTEINYQGGTGKPMPEYVSLWLLGIIAESR